MRNSGRKINNDFYREFCCTFQRFAVVSA